MCARWRGAAQRRRRLIGRTKKKEIERKNKDIKEDKMNEEDLL